MSVNIFHILPSGCTNFHNTNKLYCLPRKLNCSNTIVDGILTNNPCATDCNFSSNYKIPVPSDGNFPIQVNYVDLVSADYQNPSTGWGDWIDIGAKTIDGTDLGVTSVELGIKKNNGFDGLSNYQTIDIDLSAVAATCFYFELAANESTVSTQLFQKEECSTLIELEAVNTNGQKDCWNGYYKESQTVVDGDEFIFTPKAYIRGSVRYGGANTLTKVEAIEIRPTELIPDWYAKYIINRIFSGTQVKINGEIYDTPDVFISPTARSRRFNFSFAIERNCAKQNDGELCQ